VQLKPKSQNIKKQQKENQQTAEVLMTGRSAETQMKPHT
jgi:hypothetical protein